MKRKLSRTGNVCILLFLLCVSNLFAQTADQRAESLQNGTNTIFMSADKSYYKHNSASDNDPYGYGYWIQAHTLETLADAYQRTRNTVYKDRMKSIIAGIRKYNSYGAGTYHNDFYDDLEWLCLASFNCYNATKDPEFLDAVHQMWTEIKTGYANGAMSWKKGCTTPCKNSIANSPAIVIAVKLYQLEGDNANLQMAKDIHAWMKTNVFNVQGGIWDAPDNTDPTWQFSYNSGMFIAASLELNLVTGTQSYIDDGIKACEFMMNYRNYNGGVFFLNENGQGDGGLFKGIFAKWFIEFVRMGNLTQAQKERYLSVINYTSNYVWAKAVNKSNFLINSDWNTTPTGTIDLSTQTTGLHLFESVASLNKVHVYQNINYSGFYSQLSAGTYTLAQLQARGIVDNDITSLTVPSGYVVTVYENDNFGGTSKVFTANSAWLADWNDRISSIKIVDTNSSLINVYQDVTYGGYTAGLNAGDYTLAQLQAKGILDNDITSLKITEGYKVTLYDGDNFTGASKDFTANTDWTADWNDRATSLRIRTNGTASLGNVTYFLQNRHSGLYMDVWGQSTADGGNIAQGNYTGASNQKFKLIDAGDGAYQIQALNSGKALDVAGVSVDNGANVHQWSYVGGANQQFIAVSTGDGYYKLVAKHSGKLVEVAGFSTVSGGNVQQWENGNQASGHWKLIPTGTAKSSKSLLKTEDEAETVALNVYPNPVENTLFFTTKITGTHVSIFSAAGSLVSEQKVMDNSLDVSRLATGIYFAVFDKDGTKITKRFIKK
jgi:predicted alpha-1,6-mannanase (GH76 family)